MQKRKGITGAEAVGEEVRKLKEAFPRFTKMLIEDPHRDPVTAKKQPGVHQGRRRCHHGKTTQRRPLKADKPRFKKRLIKQTCSRCKVKFRK